MFISCQETVGPHNILVWVHIRNALCHVIVPAVTRGVALQARGQGFWWLLQQVPGLDTPAGMPCDAGTSLLPCCCCCYCCAPPFRQGGLCLGRAVCCWQLLLLAHCPLSAVLAPLGHSRGRGSSL